MRKKGRVGSAGRTIGVERTKEHGGTSVDDMERNRKTEKKKKKRKRK